MSQVMRQKLIDLGRHYDQYVETKRLKTADIKPDVERGAPHFKRRGERISIPFTITHDGTVGQARFTGEHTVKIAKMGEIKLSRSFPVLNYRYKTVQLFQLPDGGWRITISCDIPDEKPIVTEPTIVGVDRNVGNVTIPDCVIMVPEMYGCSLE